MIKSFEGPSMSRHISDTLYLAEPVLDVSTCEGLEGMEIISEIKGMHSIYNNKKTKILSVTRFAM